MERRRITCPDTAHLEEIEIERTPFGILVTSCSRFSPPCSVACGGDCAARLDRREQAALSDLRERVLVVSATDAPEAGEVAEQLASLLRRDEFVVELASPDLRSAPPPQDYEAVVIVAPAARRRLARATADYVVTHQDALAAMPSFCFFVWPGEAPADLDDRIRKLALRIGDEVPAVTP